MVIVKLIGGLGNQLFQYAAARRISYINDTPIKIDISPFATYKLHKYSLKPFNIIEEFATPDDLAKVKCTNAISGAWRRLLAKDCPYYRRPIVQEQFFHFDPNILKVSGSLYLNGYWQSEKYFKDIEEIIRREFTIKLKPDEVNRRTAEIIANTNSVSVHVRRGDYVNDANTNEVHGTCPLEYYREAIEIIARQAPNPHFFVFSDNPVWVKKNLTINYTTTCVTHNNADKNYEDLRLISLCRHNIIANSTFSWWGAWLNPDPDKIIVAPKKWFNSRIAIDTDLIPKKWIRV